MDTQRIYPQACTSAFCGHVECPETCKNLAALRDFKQWVKDTEAIVEDPIWSPSVYVAKRRIPCGLK